MWGDTEAAINLQASDALASLLFQITGPAHIPWQDQRWQELLHGYSVWVHTESRDTGILRQACTSLTSHAPQSSNLAAFSMHITRMIRDLIATNATAAASTTTDQQQGIGVGNRTRSGVSAAGVHEFSSRIAMVGKARAAAGSLNLFRILVHAVIVHSTNEQVPAGYLQECFTYKSRETNKESDTGATLLTTLLEYISSNPSLCATIPELYDATVMSLELLLVLLSSQLYEPMLSSFQRLAQAGAFCDVGMFWGHLMQSQPIATRSSGDNGTHDGSHSSSWTPRQLLQTLLDWTVHRPPAPPRSIARHNAELAQSVVNAKGEKLGSDGMYESHVVVNAACGTANSSSALGGSSHETAIVSSSSGFSEDFGSSASRAIRRHSNILLDATKGVLVLSSSIILLPFRLVSLALGLWGHSRERGYDQAHKKLLNQQSQLTKDVMWLSDSNVADLASCLLLLLIHNDRAASNPFRNEMAALVDNRWETDEPSSGFPDLPDLPAMNGAEHDEAEPLMDLVVPTHPLLRSSSMRQADVLTFNFELLFESFGRTSHTEVGAILLYSLLQCSQAFADAIAVRSDLDTLVLPLLRTLYFSSSLRHYAAQDYASRGTGTTTARQRRSSNDSLSSNSHTASTILISIRSCPFRSQSQLYVIIILLLLFSQDVSFGTDAFRRVHVSTVLWYKERYLKDINMGSILVLCMLRTLTFNLNRLHDSFLLSNCCAILMNLSPSITDLHEYASMRLVAMTLAVMKRYTTLCREHPDDDEESMSTPTAMHGEVTRTLLRVLKQSLSSKNVDRNLNLVYALVYHQTDWKKQTGQKGFPFRKSELDRIHQVISTASSIIEDSGEARTAARALKLLAENMDQIREAVAEKRKRESEVFTFTYEEDADPETFFVPYIWEVIVCVATASLIEWSKPHIRVFPLLEDPHAEHPVDPPETPEPAPNFDINFSKDVSDVV